MPLEAPNLDNRTYDGMLGDARRKIAEVCPGWTDLGASDPGSVLLEAFTFLTDQMIYRLNRLPEKAFLEFIHSQAFKDVTTWGKEQILSGRPQHKIYKH